MFTYFTFSVNFSQLLLNTYLHVPQVPQFVSIHLKEQSICYYCSYANSKCKKFFYLTI